MKKETRVKIILAVAVVVVIGFLTTLIPTSNPGENTSDTSASSQTGQVAAAVPEEVKPDFDFTFTLEMAEAKVLGMKLSELTQEKLQDYIQEQALEYNEFDSCYVDEGYFIRDDMATENNMKVMGIDYNANIYPTYVQLFKQDMSEHHLLRDYVGQFGFTIEVNYLGRTCKEFFDTIESDVYEKVSATPLDTGNNASKITFKNGYIMNVTEAWGGTWGMDEFTLYWRVCFEENGQQWYFDLHSISGETIDFVTLMRVAEN